MELFKITCVTCKAKLSVRNREVIGQIVACPRCDSMVQVEAPTAAASVIANTAVAPESVDQLSHENVAEQANDFADAAIEAADDFTEPLPVNEISIQAVASVAKYRLVAWTLASFVVGAAIGGAALLLRDNSVEENANSPEITFQAESVEVVVPLQISEESTPGTADLQDPVAEEPISNVVDVATEITNDDSADVAKAEPAATQERVQAIRQPRVASRFDALDLDLDTFDLETLKNAAAKQTVEEPPPTVSDSVVPKQDPPPAQAATLPAVRRDPDQEHGAKTQATKLLEQRFQALEVKSMPLSDFLNLVSRLGGVPISVAPQQLQMAGITSRQSVSLDAKDISLAESLNRVLKPLHLESTAVGEQVVIVRQDAAKVRTIDYPLEDLLNSTTSLEDLVGWVEQLVAPAARPLLDQTVVLKTSASTMSIEQPQHFQYQVLIFLERLRLARDIPLRSRFPVKRLADTAALATLAERLRTSTTFTFSHYTPVAEIVRYWQQDLGIPILVDWSALAELSLWPNSRIACAAENMSWSEALDQVLDPLGLGWRAVAGGAVEITSAKKAQTELQLELYRLKRELGDQTERVLSELRDIVGKEIAANKNPAAIDYDPVGKVLLVLQPAAAQRLVYQWLVDEKLAASDVKVLSK